MMAPARVPIRSGFTVLELLVTISIIGIVAALVLPAVGAARESARRVNCVNNLRETGLAVHSHHHSLKRLPVGWEFDPSGSSAFGWAVALLPYIGQPSLHDLIDTGLPVGDVHNDQARETTLSLMLCPSDIVEESFVLYTGDDEAGDDYHAGSSRGAVDGGILLTLPSSNYVGMFGTFEMDDQIPAPIGDGAFLENRKVRFRDFRRGQSHTLLVGERTMAQVPSTWYGVDLSGEDAPARLVGATLEGINKPYADECDFSSRHPGGANFLFADGHVDLITEDIDLRLYHELARLSLRGE